MKIKFLSQKPEVKEWRKFVKENSKETVFERIFQELDAMDKELKVKGKIVSNALSRAFIRASLHKSTLLSEVTIMYLNNEDQEMCEESFLILNSMFGRRELSTFKDKCGVFGWSMNKGFEKVANWTMSHTGERIKSGDDINGILLDMVTTWFNKLAGNDLVDCFFDYADSYIFIKDLDNYNKAKEWVENHRFNFAKGTTKRAVVDLVADAVI